jgi:endo-1,4-beta-mannosidase
MTKYGDIKGVNYYPSYSHDTMEVWSIYNNNAVDKELGFAADMGFNCIRIWINYNGYKKSKNRMLRDVDRFLDLCEKHSLKCIFIPFCSCYVDLLDRSKDEMYATSFLENFQVPANEMKEYETYWKRYLSYPQSPGYTMLDPKYWKVLESYLTDLIEPHKGDSRILAWDIMNEPFAFPTMDKKRIVEFLEHMCTFSKNIAGSTPITVGISSWSHVSKVEKFVDLITFHLWDLEEYGTALSKAKNYEKETGKPVLVSEFGNNFFFKPPSTTDEEQLQFYKKYFPKILNSGIGWLVWELTVGSDAFAHCGIIYPNGHRRPAAHYLVKHLK